MAGRGAAGSALGGVTGAGQSPGAGGGTRVADTPGNAGNSMADRRSDGSTMAGRTGGRGSRQPRPRRAAADARRSHRRLGSAGWGVAWRDRCRGAAGRCGWSGGRCWGSSRCCRGGWLGRCWFCSSRFSDWLGGWFCSSGFSDWLSGWFCSSGFSDWLGGWFCSSGFSDRLGGWFCGSGFSYWLGGWFCSSGFSNWLGGWFCSSGFSNWLGGWFCSSGFGNWLGGWFCSSGFGNWLGGWFCSSGFGSCLGGRFRSSSLGSWLGGGLSRRLRCNGFHRCTSAQHFRYSFLHTTNALGQFQAFLSIFFELGNVGAGFGLAILEGVQQVLKFFDCVFGFGLSLGLAGSGGVLQFDAGVVQFFLRFTALFFQLGEQFFCISQGLGTRAFQMFEQTARELLE